MKRHKHNLSHYHLTTFDMGQLIPVGCVEVLPGDSFQQSTSALIRVTPQQKPVMHPVNCQIHHFYVPNRLLWSGWEDFITGVSETPPPVKEQYSGINNGVSRYLGATIGINQDICALPIRAYNAIYNEFYRDQDLSPEVDLDSNAIQRACWSKDYFTTARPWSQQGNSVTIPIGSTAPVMGIGIRNPPSSVSDSGILQSDDSNTTQTGWVNTGSSSSVGKTDIFVKEGSTGYPDIYADLSAAEAIDITDFREAFALQRYKEARARYGSNYVDYLRYIGVTPSDARMQRPEYLGGGRQSLSFSEVLSTADTTGSGVGELYGHGIGALKTNRYRRFFEEHGYVITMMVVRPKPIYVNGLHRSFTRTTKEDYFQRELQAIGQQEVLNKEVYASHSDPDGIFGYQNRYREYTELPSRVSGQMANTDSYDYHFGRFFETDTALNDTFVKCTPTKRVFSQQIYHSLEVMVNHSIQARRQVSKQAIGRIF